VPFSLENLFHVATDGRMKRLLFYESQSMAEGLKYCKINTEGMKYMDLFRNVIDIIF
jgi:hypothetical protein